MVDDIDILRESKVIKSEDYFADISSKPDHAAPMQSLLVTFVQNTAYATSLLLGPKTILRTSFSGIQETSAIGGK